MHLQRLFTLCDCGKSIIFDINNLPSTQTEALTF